MIKKIKTILIVTVLFGNIFSIYCSGGSLYTRYGLGDLYFSNSSRPIALGGLGTALLNSKYLNTNNPATIFNIKNTKFGASLNSNLLFLDDNISTATYSQVRFSGFHIAFPVKESLGMGFIFGMTPYSVVNYEVNGLNVNQNSFIDAESFDESFSGSGGISKLFLGVSTILPFNFALGATFDYYTGDIQYKSSYIYPDSVELTNSVFTNEYRYKGLGGTIGLLSPDIAEVLEFENISNFRLGFTYEFSGNISTDTNSLASTSLGESTFDNGNLITKIPSKISLGLSFTINNQYVIVADYLYQPWSKYEKNGVNSQYLRDVNRYSIGIEKGDQIKRFATFWELIKYRGGLSFEQSQYIFNGEGINTFGIHAGIAFPLGLENSIDIGLMYGIRGTTKTNLVKENIIQATFSLNFGELWFIRRER